MPFVGFLVLLVSNFFLVYIVLYSIVNLKNNLLEPKTF